jgi:HEAT repeat protein
MITNGLSFPGLAIELIVKSLVILAVALALTWFMRRSSAASRHLVLSAATVSLVMLPLVSLVMPSWSIAAVPDPFVSAHDDATSVPAGGPAPLASSPEDGARPATPGAGQALGAEKNWVRWLTWFLIAWGIGAAILLLRLIGGKLYGWRIAAAAPPVADKRLLEAVGRVARRLGITGSIPVVESDHLKVPFVWGLSRPRLILPPWAKQWPSERLEAVLHHELAHVKRRDLLSQFVAQVACCMYWVNPLSWITERRLFIERERACDDIAISRDTKPSDYAGHLMEIVEELGATPNHVWVVSAMAEGTDFKDRVLSVLDPGARRTAPGPKRSMAVLGVAALLLLPLAAVHPLSRAAATREQPGLAEDGRSDSRREADQKQTQAQVEELDHPDAKIREHAAQALAQAGDKRAVPVLIDSLADPDPDVREHVAIALGQLGDSAAVPALSRLVVSDDDAKVREHASEALGMLRDKAAIPPLIEVLRADRDPRVREHAASALGMIGRDDDAYYALVESYETDSNDRVRAHAAFGLGLMGEERAVDLLIGGLKDPDPEVRAHCAEALGFIGSRRAISYLNDALNDPDPEVRRNAERGLRLINER